MNSVRAQQTHHFFSLSRTERAYNISGGGIKFVYEKYFVYLIHAAVRRFFYIRVEQTEERDEGARRELERDSDNIYA